MDGICAALDEGALDEAVLVGGTLAYGVLLGRVIPERWHVPANLAAALASLAVAHRAGVSRADCGVRADRRALGAGAASAAAVSAAVVAAAWPAPVRRLFAEDRIASHRPGRARFEVLVRIPLATAASEEVLFRGAMLGVLLRRHRVRAAVVRASLCFGMWHVLPTLSTLRSSRLGREAQARVPAGSAIAGVVAATAAAGAGLAVLRLRTGSLAAPILAHAALNTTAYLVSRLAASQQAPAQPTQAGGSR